MRARRYARTVYKIQIRRRESTNEHSDEWKVKAVRAAFKAGVTPSRIARQCGLSQADVKKAFSRMMPFISVCGVETENEGDSSA